VNRPVAAILAIVILLTGTLVGPAPRAGAQERPEISLPAVTASPAQQAKVLDQITESAVELSRLEADRDFAGLYQRLHPDSRRLVPFAAFEGWYTALLAGKTTDELTVTGITFIDWTWGVTGTTYHDTAQVRFVQPYWVNGVREDVEGIFHLSVSDGEWYWFFGGSQAFIDEQIALYSPAAADDPAAIVQAGAAERTIRFPDVLHAHVDAYWAYQFAAADRDYRSPVGVVGFSAHTETGCGLADPIMEAAFYCVLDQTIYYSTDFRALIEEQIGDYGWVVVIAHEWGHHVQLQLGADLVGALDQSGGLAPVRLEQQADCLAGAYTQSAEQQGWLDDTDVDEAVFMTSLSGDPVGTSWGDPNAHGTGVERVDAFLHGYDSGIGGCGLDLAP
jgi:predicted metalloprotease